MDGEVGIPSRAIDGGFDSAWVESELNARSCFDFDYEPRDLDELKIRGGSIRGRASDFLSFIFQDGRWQRDAAHDMNVLLHELREGRLMIGERTRFNTLRSALIERLDRASPTGAPVAGFLARMLYRLEAFDADSFDADAEQLLTLMLAEEAEGLGGCAPEERDELAALTRALHRAVETPSLLPNLPLRRSLEGAESSARWLGFQRALGERRRVFVTEASTIARWKERMAAREIKLYALSANLEGRNYELSSAWVASMFVGDDSHWIDADFTWAIFARRDGHHEVIGDVEGREEPAQTPAR